MGLQLRIMDRCSDISYSWREIRLRSRRASRFCSTSSQKGLAVVEVKGLGVFLFLLREIGFLPSKTGQSSKPPPEQATRNLHNLTSKLAELLGLDYFPWLFGWLVTYPNGVVSGSLDMYHPNSVVGKKDMGSLRKVILATLDDRGDDKTGQSFDRDLMERCATFLVNGNFIVEPTDTSLDADETEKRVERLTDQQFAALRVFDLKDVGVIGPAGSGKTLLAIWRLRAALGGRVRAIYVCFNTALAQFLKIKFLK